MLYSSPSLVAVRKFSEENPRGRVLQLLLEGPRTVFLTARRPKWARFLAYI